MALELIQSLKKSIRMINHHIGLGGNQAHPPVNKFNAGFMTPAQKQALETAAEDAKNARGKRTPLPGGTDVLALPDGRYEIAAAKNNPVGATDSSFIEYDISTSDSGRRIYEATISSVGRHYLRTTHTGGSPTSGTNGWLFKPFQVWSGSISSGSISLVGMPEKYSGIKVRLRTTTSQSDTVELMGSNNTTSASIPNVADDEPQFQLYEIAFLFQNNTLKITRNSTLINYGSSNVDSNVANVMVTEVYVF